MISNFATAVTVPPDRPVRRRRGLLVRLLLWAVALGLAVVLGLAGWPPGCGPKPT
jgi:hypothetical protein